MRLFIFLAIGTVLMIGVMLLSNASYGIKKYKVLLSAVLFTVCGVLGTKLMFFIENGSFGGQSFFGAVFFAPVLMLLAAKLLKIPSAVMLDLCAPAECVMLALLKVSCLMTNCCRGMVLSYTASGAAVRFPSPIVEGTAALLIALLLYWLLDKPSLHGKIYPLFMVVYGVTRFGLNFLRETSPFLLGLSAGSFWAAICTVIGFAMLGILRWHRSACAAKPSKTTEISSSQRKC